MNVAVVHAAATPASNPDAEGAKRRERVEERGEDRDARRERGDERGGVPRGARERERERDGRGGPGREGGGGRRERTRAAAAAAARRVRAERAVASQGAEETEPGYARWVVAGVRRAGVLLFLLLREGGGGGRGERAVLGAQPSRAELLLEHRRELPGRARGVVGVDALVRVRGVVVVHAAEVAETPRGQAPEGAPRERRGRSPRAACRDDDVEGGRDAGTRARATRARPPASDPRGRGDGADVDGGGGERAHREEVVDVRGRRTSRPPRRARWPVPFSRHERKRSVRDDFLAPGEGKTRRGPRRHPRVEDLAKLALGSDSRVTDPRIRPVKGIWKDLPLQRVLRLCRPPSLGHISSRSTRGRDHGRHDRLRHHDVRSRLRFPTPRRPRPARSTFPAVRSARPRPRSLSRGG